MRKPAEWIKDLLWTITFAGMVAMIVRFGLGLGAATGLNDASPWGLWIAFKLGFVALAGGGFTLAAMVMIFHLDSYRPLLRRAILLALLGYGSFIVSLVFDLGLPWHIYMPVISWQHHSVMFEIAWCVILYFSVLLLEFSPVVLEHPWLQHPWLQAIRRGLHRLSVPVIIAGVVLSTLHQSSLGALFLIMPQRVHSLWYSPLIPVQFFISAIAAGVLALIVESYLAVRLFNNGLQTGLLQRLGVLGAGALWLYLGLRLADLAVRGVLPRALNGSWQSLLFFAEIVVGGIIPAMLLSHPQVRSHRNGLLAGALLGIAGVLSQRMSLSLFTMWRPAEAPYIPSGYEILLAFAIPAAAGLLYFFFVERLSIFDPAIPEVTTGSRPATPRPLPVLENGWQGALLRRSGIAVFVLAFTYAGLPARATNLQAARDLPARPALGWATLTIDADRDGLAVIFPHADHQARLAEGKPEASSACQTCHHLAFPEDEATPCSACHRQVSTPVSIFNHGLHQQLLEGNASCQECHLGEHTRQTARACQDCHTTMSPANGDAEFSGLAPGYQPILHTQCINCHRQTSTAEDRPALAGCQICHPAAPASEQLQSAQRQ